MSDKYVNASGISTLKSYIDTQDNTKQDTLVSGTNIKTINNESLLGSGNIDISGGSGDSDVFVATYNVTKFQDILDALNDGKYILFKKDGVYHQWAISYNSKSITFHNIVPYVYNAYGVNSSNLWSVSASVYFQQPLKSGDNIKTINGNTILGGGDLTISSPTKTSDLTNDSGFITSNDLPSLDTLMSDTSENAVQNKAIKSYIDKKYPPIQTQGNYKYRVYDDGTFEVWFKQTGYTITINNASGNSYRSPLTSLALPSNLYNNYTCNILHAEVNCAHNNYPAWGMLASIYDTGVNFYAMSGGSRSSSPNYTLSAYMFGIIT